MNKNKDWGVVSQLEIEADTFATLKAACVIALTYHKAAEGFNVTTDSVHPDRLDVLWTTGGELGGSKFLTPIHDPEELANEIWKWLSHSDRYNKCIQYDTDGDLEKGYKISNYNLAHWNVMFKVTPEYII